ncbi:hypothetical protein DT23_17575 [Thioclava indica]|uniref:Uncharacterized protein n=1 Tax=Thioclava indica TaxID=1353528 RepID=A0A074JLM9_9RHOB|nr:hypothetical protein DT23_17575 [Thioclava indica]
MYTVKHMALLMHDQIMPAEVAQRHRDMNMIASCILVTPRNPGRAIRDHAKLFHG